MRRRLDPLTQALPYDKSVRTRVANMATVEVELAEADGERTGSAATGDAIPAPVWQRRYPITLGLIAGFVVLGALVIARPSRTETPRPVMRFDLAITQAPSESNNTVAVSPDGMRIAYVAGTNDGAIPRRRGGRAATGRETEIRDASPPCPCSRPTVRRWRSSSKAS